MDVICRHDDFWALYDHIYAEAKDDVFISAVKSGELWSYAESSDGGAGIAMFTEGNSVPSMFPELAGLSLSSAANAVKSWNFEEASLALAAVNAALNRKSRIPELNQKVTLGAHYADGIELEGKTVGIIGHMRGPDSLKAAAKVYILERSPQPGDYPDSACELLLPKCDVVFITGSSIINKTLPRLLELSRNAYTVLTGPSVPMCPALLDCGLDRISGMITNDPASLLEHVLSGRHGSPVIYGESFLLSR